MKTSNNKILIICAVLIWASLACSELTIINNSPNSMRVMITLPEGNGVDSQVIQKGSSITYYSDIEGSYTVRAIIEEKAREELIAARVVLQEMLLMPEELGARESSGLPLSGLINRMISVDKALVNIQEISCSGLLVEDKEITVDIGFNKDTSKFVIACP